VVPADLDFPDIIAHFPGLYLVLSSLSKEP